MPKLRATEWIMLLLNILVTSAVIMGMIEPLTRQWPYDECSFLDCYKYASATITDE